MTQLIVDNLTSVMRNTHLFAISTSGNATCVDLADSTYIP